jgi:5'-3' exonuclease
VGYIKGLNRVAQVVIDLIPKYYRTPRSLPVLKPNGERSFVEINKKGALYMNYDPNSLQVKVETGVNFAMQKEMALQTVIAMSQANKGFADFFNEEGLPTLLDNIEMRGIDDLKQKATQWMAKQKQMQMMAMQQQQSQMQMEAKKQAMEMMAMQKDVQSPSEGQVAMMAIEQKAQNDAANLELKERDSQTKYLETISKIRNADVQNELKAAELDAENTRSAVEAAINISSHIQERLRPETHV